MSSIKILPITLLFALVGCSSAHYEGKSHHMGKHHNNVHVLPNTNTAIVGIPLTKDKKLPKRLEKLEIAVKVGQKVIFAGPERFEIFAKDQNFSLLKSRPDAKECVKPSQDCIESKDGVINITIPKTAFQIKRTNDKKEIIVPFGIRIDGDEIDPRLIILED